MNKEELIKPCYLLGYCPYGCMIEYSPMEDGKGNKSHSQWNNEKISWLKPREGNFKCKIFGHDCLMYYLSEEITEYRNEEERNKMLVANKI